ncbi:hypothetical protein, partial [Paramuribaculum intestinale]|uniref:hypothetical protein n=1 Tax=Paramuribaculum intestinale TaxID=2094151 RepID=UPI0025A5351A
SGKVGNRPLFDKLPPWSLRPWRQLCFFIGAIGIIGGGSDEAAMEWKSAMCRSVARAGAVG